MSNLPCKGCFWIEGGKCYNDKLAYAQGLDKTPRGNPIGSGLNGLEVDDPLLTACVETGGHASKSAIYNKAIRRLQADDFIVHRVTAT